LGWIGKPRCDTWLAHHNSHWRLQVLIPTLPQRRDGSLESEIEVTAQIGLVCLFIFVCACCLLIFALHKENSIYIKTRCSGVNTRSRYMK
jgi:hypothetical protein